MHHRELVFIALCKLKEIFLCGCFFVVVVLLSACASLDITKTEQSQLIKVTETNSLESRGDARSQNNAWTTIQVYISRGEGGETHWHVDSYLAHQVFKQVLLSHAYDIQLWRFHRRSADDTTGHRFSFIYYTSKESAEKIQHFILTNARLLQLQSEAIVLKIVVANFNNSIQTQVQDTSDPKWSDELKASWPFFIMGASQAWLALIDNIIARQPPIGEMLSLREQLVFYQGVNQEVTKRWRQEGAHAYLHHLNAIFGYENVIIYERKETRF